MDNIQIGGMTGSGHLRVIKGTDMLPKITAQGKTVTPEDFKSMLSLLERIKAELTTPQRIDDDIETFASYLGNSNEPIYIPIVPFSWSRVNCCDLNVRKAVEQLGGKEIFGFRIWSIPNKYVEADLHCVWERIDGTVVDVTPNVEDDTRTLFLPDPRVITVRFRRKGDKPRLALGGSLGMAVAMITEAEKREVCVYPPDDILWDQSLSYKRLKKGKKKRA